MSLIDALLVTLKQYIRNILYSGDIFINSFIGGDPRETISSRLGKGKKQGKLGHTILAFLVDVLMFPFDGEWSHCVRNIQRVKDRYSVSTTFKKSYKS